MASLPNGFIPASDAASGNITNLAIHHEISEIERIILVQSANGFLSTTISSTLMTSNAFNTPLVVTNLNVSNNTITVPGLAAQVGSSVGACCSSLTGIPVSFSSSNNLPTPLQTNVTYYLTSFGSTPDVYTVSTTRQNAFQCPPVIITLGIVATSVTGTQTISANVLGTECILSTIGIPGTLVINGIPVTILATYTLSQIVAAINAASIPNIVASIAYTYTDTGNSSNYNNCHCDPCNPHGNNNNNNNNNNSNISCAQLVITNFGGTLTTIGAGSTPALLLALGLTVGTYGNVGATGNLIIDGVTVPITSSDTLLQIVSAINAAAIPNIVASAVNSHLVITDATGAAITIGGTPSVLAAIGLTAGVAPSSVISVTLLPQSELYYNAWQNIYFFPEQQMYVAQMQAVMTYFQNYGYTIDRVQQTDSSGNPLPIFSWYITW